MCAKFMKRILNLLDVGWVSGVKKVAMSACQLQLVIILQVPLKHLYHALTGTIRLKRTRRKFNLLKCF